MLLLLPPQYLHLLLMLQSQTFPAQLVAPRTPAPAAATVAAPGVLDALITTLLAISAVVASADAAAMSLAPLDPRFLKVVLQVFLSTASAHQLHVEPSLREVLDESLRKRSMGSSSWPSNRDPGREHAARKA